MKEEFAERVNNKCDGNEDWWDLKRKFADVASVVCDYTKGKPRHFETWWWNKDVGVERESYLVGMRKIGRNIVRQKKDAKRVVYIAMNQKAQEAVEKIDMCCDGHELFRIAKRLGRKKTLLG